MQYETMSTDNQAIINCPIFGVDSKVSSCVKVREEYFLGRRPKQRKGCQACISNSKCPMAEVIKQISYAGTRSAPPDEMHSSSPTRVKFRVDILERVYAPVVMDRTLEINGVSAKERELIHSSNERIAKAMGGAPKAASKGPAPTARVKKKAKPIETVVENATNTAAQTGDMAALVNQEMKNG